MNAFVGSYSTSIINKTVKIVVAITFVTRMVKVASFCDVVEQNCCFVVLRWLFRRMSRKEQNRQGVFSPVLFPLVVKRTIFDC